MPKKHLAIIGNGMAASRLIDDLLQRDALRRYTITIYGEEAGGCYNRILLSKVLGGADPDSITMKTQSWYTERGLNLVNGVRVDRLDTASRHIYTSDQRTHPYDLAVLATGSVPFVPRIDGLTRLDGTHKAGVFIYRTLDDVLQIRSSARPGDNAVVLGGGLLGLEAAKALADLGLHVTVVHLLDTLMNLQLDKTGGDMLRRQIERQGIFVRTGCTTKMVNGADAVESILLDDGTVLAADMLVLACGIRPRIDIARASGIPTKNGVLVNDSLASSVPGIYAVGECAEHDGRVYGIVAPIWEQATVLADILTGAKSTTRYRGSKLYTRLKVAGIEVASMGLTEPELASDHVVQVIEERKHAYRKLIIRDGRLIGAVLIGETDAAATLVQHFDRNDPLPANPLSILCGNTPATCASSDRTICNCNKVCESTIRQAIRDGATSLDTLATCTRAGTGCGSCRGELVRLINSTPTLTPAAG